MTQLRFIPNGEINREQWDDCIDRSLHGLVYAYSWYLDAMAEHWDALVWGNYEAVMPLTWNKKYGIHYLYQPYFCASLGIFSPAALSHSQVLLFLKAIPERFRYMDIYLNKGNMFEIQEFPLTRRVNYVLPLQHSYEALFAQYRDTHKRNLRKAEAAALQYTTGIEVASIIDLAKETLQRLAPITNDQLQRFANVCKAASTRGKMETLAITGNGQLLASAVFLYSHQRWYYILVGNHPNGKTNGASHYLLDRFIHLHADTNSSFDFEGSDVRNLAFFYSGFGAHEEYYPALRINRLPKLLRWIKD